MKNLDTKKPAPTSGMQSPSGLGLGLVPGNQEVTLSEPDAMMTVIADPDLDEAREAVTKAAEQAMEIAKYLDFENHEAAASSLSMMYAQFDSARRCADASLTRQYEHECAQIDRKRASWLGVREKLRSELEDLERELSAIGG